MGTIIRTCLTLTSFKRIHVRYEDSTTIDAGIFKGNYVSDFPNSEIFDYDQVIAMPHLGASTAEAEENSSSMAADTIMSFLETGSIINSVNFPTGK